MNSSADRTRRWVAGFLVIGTAVVALLIVLGQWFAATAGRGIAEHMNRIGQADVRASGMPRGSIVSREGVAVATLDVIQVVRTSTDSADPQFYVRGTWIDTATASALSKDSTYIGIVEPPLTINHPWNIRLQRKAGDLPFIGILRLTPDYGAFGLYLMTSAGH
jgi:hypothetical protein